MRAVCAILRKSCRGCKNPRVFNQGKKKKPEVLLNLVSSVTVSVVKKKTRSGKRPEIQINGGGAIHLKSRNDNGQYCGCVVLTAVFFDRI